MFFTSLPMGGQREVLYKYNVVLREVVKITGPVSSLSHPTPRDQEFSLLLEVNHVVFVLLYLINIYW